MLALLDRSGKASHAAVVKVFLCVFWEFSAVGLAAVDMSNGATIATVPKTFLSAVMFLVPDSAGAVRSSAGD